MMICASRRLPKSSRFRHSSRSLSWSRAKRDRLPIFFQRKCSQLLDVAVLPRASRLDVDGLYFLLLEPVLDRIGDELRAVVAAQAPRTAISLEGGIHHRDDIHRPDRPPRVHRQRAPRMLVHQCQDTEPAAVLGLVLNEVPA